MNKIEKETRIGKINCITFKEKTDNVANYINIVNDKGCWSYVGKFVEKKSQLLSLSIDDGCIVEHIVIHELLHTLMLHHEHNRPDRDDWIRILKYNIKEGLY